MERVVKKMADPCDLNLLLFGKTGVGVSATANHLLGVNEFKSEQSLTPVTERCQIHTAEVSNKRVTVVDSPNFSSTTNAKLTAELKKGLSMCPSGVHAILLVFSLGTFTTQDMEVVSFFKQTFGKNAMKHTIIIFTNGDRLQNKTLEEMSSENTELSTLMKECGWRFHVLNNNELSNREQVTELLGKIEKMIAENLNSCYTLLMFETQSNVVLLRLMKPGNLYAVNLLIVVFLGYSNMSNKCLFDVKTFTYGCSGALLAAVAGVLPGVLYTLFRNQRCFRRLPEENLNYANLLGIMFACAAGGCTVYFDEPVDFSATIFRALQGGVAHYLFSNDVRLKEKTD